MNNRRPTRTIVTTAIVGLALLSLAPLAAQARGGKGSNYSPERAAQCLTGQLDLSAEQEVEVQAILEASFEQRNTQREERRAEMDVMRAATEDQFAAVLTAEQMDELRELREDRQDQRAHHRGDRGRGCDQREGRWERGNCRESAVD